MMLKKNWKVIGNANPVMTQRFGADPYALVYGGRVYLYMTGDDFIYDENGQIKENDYSNIYTINVISSADLVNWTDHGSVYAASDKGQAVWGQNAWAPAAACKMIDGRMQFFLYFANGGNGVAVLRADSPVGPFTDPISKPLISREETPACADVTWLFDPAVLVDDDGQAYIYFGGGVPSKEQADNPGTARVAKLGADMISLDGVPKVIENVPYLYEDSGINKVNGRYIYTYCSNFSVPDEVKESLGFGCGEIIAMESAHPMGPFTMRGSILKNPEDFFGIGGNNHHCMFAYEGQWYMSYHSRILEREMNVMKGYRSTNIDRVTVDDNGQILPVTGSLKGVRQVRAFNPYEKIPAATMAVMAGIQTVPYGKIAVTAGSGEMIITNAADGDWMGIYGADFGAHGAETLEVEVRAKDHAVMQVHLGAPDGERVAAVIVAATDGERFEMITVSLEKKVCGVHDIYFVFSGDGCDVRSWKFKEE